MKAAMGLLIALLPSTGMAQAPPGPPPPVAIAHVTVIDGTGAPPRADQTVLIVGGRIAAVGKIDASQFPTDTQVVNAWGQYLIPGLWDMHLHTALSPGDPRYAFPLLITNGVTGVRDMSGPLEVLRPYLQEVTDGRRVGPRMVIAGAVLDGKPSTWPGAIPIADAQEARQAVATLKQQGADFVKVYSLLSREAYFAIADEARKQQLPLAGHVPSSVSAAEASDAGQKSIEHLHAILLACPARETPGVLESAGDEGAAALFRRFVENGTWIVPTNIVEQALTTRDPTDARLKYIPLAIQRLWAPIEDMFTPGEAESNAALTRRERQKSLELVAAMHRAGVAMLAGTDTAPWNPYTFPGFSLHDQLALLVQAGLTPMEAIQMATLNPARFLGKEGEFGTVRTGRMADLVLLNGNPLQDIRNTTKIHAVIVGGRLLDRAELDRMLAEVEVGAR